MMISQEYNYNEESFRFPQIFRPIRQLIERTINRYNPWKQKRQNLAVLLTMEDRMRKDIGLSRVDTDRFRNAYTFRVMFQPELHNLNSGVSRTTNYN